MGRVRQETMHDRDGGEREDPPVVGRGRRRRLFGPRRRGVGDEAHVVVGAGRRLVGEVWREERRPVVLDDHRVVLRHVDGRGQLVVS